MSAVHRSAMVLAQKGGMKMLKLSLAAGLALIAMPAQADEEERVEVYQSLLSCAAFHTIESTKTSGDASAAQMAAAYDYAGSAVPFAPDGRTDTANNDLKLLLESFKQKLETGEPRDMAEQWTGLESACRELYSAKDALVAKRKAEIAAKPGEAR